MVHPLGIHAQGSCGAAVRRDLQVHLRGLLKLRPSMCTRAVASDGTNVVDTIAIADRSGSFGFACTFAIAIIFPAIAIIFAPAAICAA